MDRLLSKINFEGDLVKDTSTDKSYSFLSNIAFMWHEHWAFDKLFLFLPIMKIPLTVSVSLLGILLPKIVLDALTVGTDINQLIFQVAICAGALTLFSILSSKVENTITIHANQFFSLYGFYNIAEKKVNMDYEIFASPKGKISAKKAQRAIQGNIRQSMVSFFLGLTEVLTNAFGLFSFLAILITLNPWIILFLLLSYVIDGIVALLIEKWLHKVRDEEAELERKTQYISQRVTLTAYAKDIRIYSLAGWLKAIREALLQREISLHGRIERRFMMQLLIEGFLVFLRDGLAYTYLIYRMLNDPSMSIGTFTLYFATISGFGNWLSNMVINGDAVIRANLLVSDYRSFIDIEDNTFIADGIAVANEKEAHSIRLVDVTYQYPESDQVILDHINLEIHAGENLALVGINGAGKTTFVKLVCGLIRPTSGEIYLDGINIKKIDREKYFKLFSVVFQDLNILPIEIDRNITFKDNRTQIEEDRLQQAIAASGLDEKIYSLPQGEHTKLLKQFNENAIELSGGELQKLLLARAIYKDAPILILDEPTAAMDPVAENRLYLQYNLLTKNKTSIFISHRLSSTRFCERIILLDGGRITESGSHDELMALGGKYAAMFEVSSKYYRDSYCEREEECQYEVS